MVNYTPRLVERDELENRMDQTVEDVLNRAPLTLRPDFDMMRATQLISAHEVTGAPVVTDDGILVGYVSEKDCLRYAYDTRYYNQESRTVQDYMAKNLLTVRPSDNVLSVMELFIKNQFQQYPVVNASNHLLGVITRRKMIEVIQDMGQTNW